MDAIAPFTLTPCGIVIEPSWGIGIGPAIRAAVLQQRMSDAPLYLRFNDQVLPIKGKTYEQVMAQYWQCDKPQA